MAGASARRPPRRLLLIFNPVAGWRRRRKLRPALAVFRRRGITVDIHETRWAGDATAVARAVDARYDAVVSGGGDGTINEVINGLMARTAAGEPTPPLGILPLGTANVLAAELGLPLQPAAAAAAIADGAVGRIGVGLANGRYFALMVGAGFDAYVVAGVRIRLKRWFGRGAYAWELLTRLIDYPEGGYRVIIDGRTIEAASVVVARSRFYAGRFVLAPAAGLSRPGLQVCLFDRAGRRAALAYMLAMLRGRLDGRDDYRVVAAERLTVLGAEGAPVQADGDIIATVPLEIAVAPHPLAVIVPPAGAAGAA